MNVGSKISSKSYYPFGMVIPGRSFSTTAYKWGFNGKEKDDEVSGSGNQYDYGFRIYNPRIAKFLSVDPLTASYPWLTPYQFAENCPIQFIDIDGLESGWNLTEIGAMLTMQAGDLGNIYRKPQINPIKSSPQIKVPEQSFVQGGIQGTAEFKIITEREKVAYEISKYAPVTGDVHDGKDAINNFLAGNYKAAAFSAFFLIPGSDLLKLIKPFSAEVKGLIKSAGYFEKSSELIIKTTSNTFGDAKKIANEILDLGDNPIQKISTAGTEKTNPFFGKVVGESSRDGKKSWRVDWDEKKGAHINVSNGKGDNSAIQFGAAFEQVKSIVNNEVLKK